MWPLNGSAAAWLTEQVAKVGLHPESENVNMLVAALPVPAVAQGSRGFEGS